jgi:phospholipid transport system substrate-binding protein
MRHKWIPLCCTVLMILLSAIPLSWADNAMSEVKTILERAMEIQTRPDLQGPEGRKQRAKGIRQLIAEHFLAREMARTSLEDHWEALSPKQQAEFQEIFTDLFQDSYTRMVLNFLKRETIEYKNEQRMGPGVRVQTIILRTNEHIPVDYDLVEKDGRWFVQDVMIDGVSIVGNYKNAFRRVILNQSFEALLSKMRLQRLAIQERESS